MQIDIDPQKTDCVEAHFSGRSLASALGDRSRAADRRDARDADLARTLAPRPTSPVSELMWCGAVLRANRAIAIVETGEA